MAEHGKFRRINQARVAV